MESIRAAVITLGALSAQSLGAVAPGSISFERLAIPNDTPAHLASALAQDRAGFLWIGTQGGLVRWDGTAFRLFASDVTDGETLGGAYVRALLPARDGRLWVGTFGGGLSVYDPVTERFGRFRADPGRPGSLSSDRVEGLAEDRSGAIWIATSGGLDRLDPASGTIRHFHHEALDASSLASNAVRAVLVDRDDRLWVGSRGALQRLSLDGESFERVGTYGGEDDPFSADAVERLFQASDGRIWIGTAAGGAAVLELPSGTLRRLRGRDSPVAAGLVLSHRWVYGFAEPRPGEIWIATFGGGIDIVDAATLRVAESLRHDPVLPSTIGSDRVGSLLVDRSGLVWVGSWGQGIARHDPSTRAFRALRASPNRPEGLSQAAVVRVLPLPDGSIWAGTNGNGIDILDADGRLIGALRQDARDPRALADGAVTCLARDDDGTIWIATLDGTLHRKRVGAADLDRLDTSDGLPGGPIRALAFGDDGALWAGSANGLASVDRATLSVRSFVDWPGSAATPAIEAIVTDGEGREGKLFVGTDNGLYRFDLASATAERFARDPARADSLPDNWVPDLLRTSDGTLWVGTAGGACRLLSWRGKATSCEPLAAKLGRRSEPAQALLEDQQGWIWIGSRLRFDPRTFASTLFTNADGAVFHNYFIASRALGADGRLYFGSPEGLLIVDPRALAIWEYAPPVVATSLAVDGRQRPGAAELSELELRSADRGFRIGLAALDLSAPELTRLRVRLLGYDAGWAEGGVELRSAAYSNLAPGHYTLEVEGTNRAGRWSEAALRLPVIVRPAYYQTTAFRAAVAAVAVALALGAHRLRVHQLRRRAEALERTVTQRTSELASANSELRIAYARIGEASLTDPLTGLRNRRYIEQVIPADIEHSVRAHRVPGGQHVAGDLVFLLLDIDHFKSINDSHGHASGDAVLVEIAGLLRATFRTTDHLVRWGGEEFLVVARFLERSEAPLLAEKLRAAIEQHDFTLPTGSSIARTASIGLASFPLCPQSPRAVPWEQIVALADLALYAAKRSGRNGWVGIEAVEGEPAARIAVAVGELVAAPAKPGREFVVSSSRAPGTLVWK